MLKIAHIAIVTKDIEKSKDFYIKVLGAKVVGITENERLKFVYLNTGGQVIELLQYHEIEQKEREKGTIDHIAFYVDDLEKEIKRLKKLDVEFLFDSVREVNNMKIMFFAGPDGERIELMEKL